MKRHSSNATRIAFTLVEVLVVIAIIAVLLAMVIPTKDRRAMRSTIVSCMNNQRQIAIGQMMWAADHNELFPWQVSSANVGTMEFARTGSAAPHFQALSNHLVHSKYLICSTDTARHVATSFAQLGSSNLSYFISLDAALTNMLILTGDRHLQVNRQSVKPGLLVLNSNATIGWTRELHRESADAPIGILSFTDGHAEAVKEKLPDYFRRQNLAINRLAIP